MKKIPCLSLRTFFGHAWALTWKNHLLKMRNPGIIIAEIIYPILNCSIIPLQLGLLTEKGSDADNYFTG
jgi:hypothetical protein